MAGKSSKKASKKKPKKDYTEPPMQQLSGFDRVAIGRNPGPRPKFAVGDSVATSEELRLGGRVRRPGIKGQIVRRELLGAGRNARWEYSVRPVARTILHQAKFFTVSESGLRLGIPKGASWPTLDRSGLGLCSQMICNSRLVRWTKPSRLERRAKTMFVRGKRLT